MIYRAIRWMNEGDSFDIHHFSSIVDSYKWLVPSTETQQQERWHIRSLWTLIESFKEHEATIKIVGYNDPHNPEEFPTTHLYIQRVETIHAPIPPL